MRPEYLAELAKVHEPPEMFGKPMQVRKAVSPNILKLGNAVADVDSPEKATHEQRTTAIRRLLEIANSKERDDGVDRVITYGAIAIMACIDGAEPQTVIGYANKAIGDEGDDALALRARMYLKAGKLGNALDDLEKIMVDRNEHVLAGAGGTDPRKDSVPCGWGIADFDAFGNDPRALAAKGLYLSEFLGFGAQSRGTVKEADIRDLYTRSSQSWRSPIPHYLVGSLYGIGSEHSMTGAGCIRPNSGNVPEIVSACARYDEGIREQIRELTMSLVIAPTFAPALTARASVYLNLAQGSYADGKPSRTLFKLAIKDYTDALAAGSKKKHVLYCDRALAQASIGMYQDAALGFLQGMKYAKNGIEDSPFVYQQLAGVYVKMRKFNEAADLITQAIINASGAGMDAVIFGGGIKAFRTLYPEYALLPDEILAEAVRRRYYPQFPQSWDADFISEGGAFNGKIASSILPELYVARGDAYMKAGRHAEALADYRRVKSDAWIGEERFLPRYMWFNKRGNRNYDLPEPWPTPRPTL